MLSGGVDSVRARLEAEGLRFVADDADGAARMDIGGLSSSASGSSRRDRTAAASGTTCIIGGHHAGAGRRPRGLRRAAASQRARNDDPRRRCARRARSRRDARRRARARRCAVRPAPGGFVIARGDISGNVVCHAAAAMSSAMPRLFSTRGSGRALRMRDLLSPGTVLEWAPNLTEYEYRPGGALECPPRSLCVGHASRPSSASPYGRRSADPRLTALGRTLILIQLSTA